MAQLPANRTKLNSAISDQSQSITPASGKANREALLEAYDTIDFLNQKVDNLLAAGTLTYIRTSANLTYYVNAATGNDANDGLTSGTALKTVQAAINKIPQIVNHAVTINYAAGTSAENVVLPNFDGGGTVSWLGDTTASDAYAVTSVKVTGCKCRIVIRGIKCTTTTADGFGAIDSSNVEFNACKIDTVTASFQGVQFTRSNGTVKSSVLANRYGGITVDEYSTVYADTNFGTGNTYGLISRGASTIGKASATQPAGTSAEFSGFGGIIR